MTAAAPPEEAIVLMWTATVSDGAIHVTFNNTYEVSFKLKDLDDLIHNVWVGTCNGSLASLFEGRLMVVSARGSPFPDLLKLTFPLTLLNSFVHHVAEVAARGEDGE